MQFILVKMLWHDWYSPESYFPKGTEQLIPWKRAKMGQEGPEMDQKGPKCTVLNKSNKNRKSLSFHFQDLIHQYWGHFGTDSGP